MKHIHLTAIRFDSTTQVRAEINDATVTDYAERMVAGDIFPPAELFEESGAYYIGDGWHRLLAAQKNGDVTIQANAQPGGRVAAIKCALGANATHGLKRTNADKRRSVEVALSEFGNLSDREIAKICAVSHTVVASLREQLATVASSTTPRLGADGKVRKLPAKQAVDETVATVWPEPITAAAIKEAAAPVREIVVTVEDVEPAISEQAPPKRERFVMPNRGMFIARGAVNQIETILPDDGERHQAITFVRDWCNTQLNKDNKA